MADSPTLVWLLAGFPAIMFLEVYHSYGTKKQCKAIDIDTDIDI